MFEMPMPQAKKEVPVVPFRERTPVWKSIVEEGVESTIVDDVIEKITASPNDLFHFSTESAFRETIARLVGESVSELLKREEKNFSGPIDQLTNKWDYEIAQSDEDPDEEIKYYGNTLMKNLITLAGGKQNLVDKVIALMRENEQKKQLQKQQKNIQ